MNRKEMLDAARQRAYEMVDDSSALTDEEFKKLQSLPEETAVNRLAVNFLDEALADNDVEDEEPSEVDDEDEEDDSDSDTGYEEDDDPGEDEDSRLEW